MTDAGIPPTPPRLLPDAVHKAVGPGTALLRLETTRSRQGVLDGAWWPRSRNVELEVPPLVTVLTEHLGPITRVGLDASAWNDIPPRLLVDGRVVHLDSFPVADDTVLITRGDHDHFALMVVPPDTTPEAARAAMARAVHADNVTRAAEILLAELPHPTAPSAGTVLENEEGPGQRPGPSSESG
ncbi:DUF5994 family protein [Streptomyces sp. CC208A]|uniref:DUF5994 family protein n=1 Tax=Streptomyces sp. CC208A TaxID=3044573 RepID=UPI0024A7C9F0|nr:DUF5994 family protein [Streptomyces sp. CC208A]